MFNIYNNIVMTSYIFTLYELLPYTTGAYNTLYYGLYASNMIYSTYKFINGISPKKTNIIYHLMLENTNIDIDRKNVIDKNNKLSKDKKQKKIKLTDKYTAEDMCNLYKISNDNGDISEIVELASRNDDDGFVNYDFQVTTKEELTKLSKREKKVLLNNWSKIDII